MTCSMCGFKDKSQERFGDRPRWLSDVDAAFMEMRSMGVSSLQDEMEKMETTHLDELLGAMDAYQLSWLRFALAWTDCDNSLLCMVERARRRLEWEG